jgi:hypothetical protein
MPAYWPHRPGKLERQQFRSAIVAYADPEVPFDGDVPCSYKHPQLDELRLDHLRTVQVPAIDNDRRDVRLAQGQAILDKDQIHQTWKPIHLLTKKTMEEAIDAPSIANSNRSSNLVSFR